MTPVGTEDARSMAPLLPVMPMAVRRDPGMGCAFKEAFDALQTSRSAPHGVRLHDASMKKLPRRSACEPRVYGKSCRLTRPLLAQLERSKN